MENDLPPKGQTPFQTARSPFPVYVRSLTTWNTCVFGSAFFKLVFVMMDFDRTSFDLLPTGQARISKHFCSPESMFHHRFRILTPLLILWQILLPLCAYALHDCVDALCAGGSCDSARSERSENYASGLGCCRCRFHRGSADSEEDSEEHLPEHEKHDCSNCSICQAIAAPRILVTTLEVTRSAHLIGLISVWDRSDPMLGFRLPPQCRAPPRS